MLKSRSRMLVTLAAVALMGFAASVRAQLVPASSSASPPRIEQAAVADVATAVAVAAPVLAVERAQFAADVAKTSASIERSPVAMMVMASVIALPGYAALMGASTVHRANAHARSCDAALSISCPVGWN